VIARQVRSRRRHERGEAREEVERLESRLAGRLPER